MTKSIWGKEFCKHEKTRIETFELEICEKCGHVLPPKDLYSVVLSDGTWVIAYEDDEGAIRLIESKDNGVTWRSPEPIALLRKTKGE